MIGFGSEFGRKGSAFHTRSCYSTDQQDGRSPFAVHYSSF